MITMKLVSTSEDYTVKKVIRYSGKSQY